MRPLPILGPALVLAAYLLGSVSFGLLIARRRGVELRKIGSGNIGATNVGRALGKKTGALVLVLDALKGVAPALAATWLFGYDSPWTAATGVAAVIGHVLPVWHGFRGGKGAATSAGVLLAVVPLAGAAAVAVFFALRAATHRASVGSLTGALTGTGVTVAHEGRGWPTAMAAALFAIVLVRHAANIGRLLRGKEPRA